MIPTQQFFNPLPNCFSSQQYMTQNLLFPMNHSLPIQLSNNFPLIHPSFFRPTVPSLSNFNDALAQLQASHSLQTQLLNQQFQNLCAYNSQLNHKVSSPISLDSKSKIDSPEPQPASPVKPEPKPLLDLPNDPEIRLEAQVKYMVQFFVSNLGVVSKKEINQAKARYQSEPKLLAIFNAIQAKYSATIKTREEMIKWIIRRSLKSSRKSVKGAQTNNKKQAMNELCKRYFAEGDGNDSGDDIADSMLPFRKNSKNKTMNTNFITEIFQSEGFKQDFKVFLTEFDEIADAENAEKIRRFSRAIMECAKKNNFDSIAKYKRVPWLKAWVQNTKIVALELDEGDFIGKTSKKLKTHY